LDFCAIGKKPGELAKIIQGGGQEVDVILIGSHKIAVALS
jgi:hypothetical protein